MKRLAVGFAVAGLLSFASLARALDAPAPPPSTAKRPVTTEYHGVKVTEDYRWLEDAHSPEVRAWANAQNQRARAWLAKLPSVDAIHDRVSALVAAKTSNWFDLRWKGKQLFALKSQPPKQHAFLIVRASADGGDERVLVDPGVIDPSQSTAIDWYVPSLDGKVVAVSLSKGGSERGDLHFFDVATGKALPDVLEHVQNGTAGGSAAFTADGRGVFYTRYPRDGEKPKAEQEFWQQIWFHQLGTPSSSDTYVLGKELPRIAEIKLSSTDDGRFFLADVANGDGGEHAYWLRGTDGKWKQLSQFSDQIVGAELGAGGDRHLYLLSIAGAPRGEVLRLPLATPTLKQAKKIVPAGEGAINGLIPTATRLWVVDLLGGPSRLRSFSLDGKNERLAQTPPVSSMAAAVRLDGDQLLGCVRSYVQPTAWLRFSPTEKPVKTALFQTSPADFSDVEVVRETATSKDGTKVPVTLLHRKGLAKDGKNPLLLTGYGGFAISLEPGFKATNLVWLEQGGVVAIANLRGGGEFGDVWHKQGMLTHKQNVFDDFIAVAQHLVDEKWTSPPHLAIIGGSNGGLLMGAVTVQHPELFKAVVAKVGLYDMLRSELSPNGAFITTEYGSVKDAEQFKALYAYSPYHHVVDGTKYPAMLFTAGDNDPRVDPLHSRKMVARLQAATASATPILLRTSDKAGHGIGTSLDEAIAEEVDTWAFLFAELGVSYKRPTAQR